MGLIWAFSARRRFRKRALKRERGVGKHTSPKAAPILFGAGLSDAIGEINRLPIVAVTRRGGEAKTLGDNDGAEIEHVVPDIRLANDVGDRRRAVRVRLKKWHAFWFRIQDQRSEIGD